MNVVDTRTMTKPEWTLDTINRRVVHNPTGFTALMQRIEGQWQAGTPNQGDDQSILERAHADLLPEALRVWNGEIATAAATLVKAGHALHGAEWIMPLAADLGISRDTIRFWLNGKTPFTRSHPVWKDVIRILGDRATTIDTVQDEIINMMTEAAPGATLDRRRAKSG